MRTIKFCVLIIGLLIISCNSKNLAESRTGSVLLYEVTGPAMPDTSYIFGTLHFVPKADFYIPEILNEKLIECDALVIETNIDIPIKQQVAIAQRSILPDSKSLRDYVSQEVYDETLGFMTDSLGFSDSRAEKYMHLKPLYLMGPLLIGYYGRVENYEKEFVITAEKKKKELLFLEEVEFQLNLLDSISIEDQVKEFSIYRMLDDYEKMLNIYLEQDLDKLEEYIHSTSDFKKYEEAIINIRNQNWLPILTELMEDKSLFVAVGAGHLHGDKGLLHLLSEAGFSVKQLGQ